MKIKFILGATTMVALMAALGDGTVARFIAAAQSV